MFNVKLPPFETKNGMIKEKRVLLSFIQVSFFMSQPQKINE